MVWFGQLTDAGAGVGVGVGVGGGVHHRVAVSACAF